MNGLSTINVADKVKHSLSWLAQRNFISGKMRFLHEQGRSRMLQQLCLNGIRRGLLLDQSRRPWIGVE